VNCAFYFRTKRTWSQYLNKWHQYCLQKDTILKILTINAANVRHVHSKVSITFLGTSGRNIMTHAYWWQCNTVMWQKKYQSDITSLSATLWNYRVTSNSLLANNCTVSSSVWLQTGRPGFNKVCVSVVNNNVCVVVMLNIHVMYIRFQLHSKTEDHKREQL
jgi:hypothetical protein